jgi:hypothetical protein
MTYILTTPALAPLTEPLDIPFRQWRVTIDGREAGWLTHHGTAGAAYWTWMAGEATPLIREGWVVFRREADHAAVSAFIAGAFGVAPEALRFEGEGHPSDPPPPLDEPTWWCVIVNGEGMGEVGKEDEQFVWTTRVGATRVSWSITDDGCELRHRFPRKATLAGVAQFIAHFCEVEPEAVKLVEPDLGPTAVFEQCPERCSGETKSQ